MGRNKNRKPEIQLRSKLKKDPGIPRLPDLKQRTAQKQRASYTPPGRIADQDASMASEPTLSSIAAQAASQAPQEPQHNLDQDPSSSRQKTMEQLRRHYVRTLHKVIDESDVVVLVLDARDPEGCRSRLVEEEVRRREAEGKKLVFVLNKIDLVPRENAQLWLRHLRHSTPTLPFRSASNAQRSNLSSSTAPALLKLLKAYRPSAAQSVSVGVVGYPNVGKSSLINSLKRAKVCAVAATPGHTKELQSVQVERGIRVVDSPGVIFDENDDDADGKGTKKGSILLRNVLKVEDLEDPIAVVEEILARTEHDKLQHIYSLPEFTSTLEFLTMLALTSGRLLKGGTPDILSAARQVLSDWNAHKIPYFSVPPAIHPSSLPSTVPAHAAAPKETAAIAPGAEQVGQAQILTELSKPFELAGLFGTADAGAFGEEPGPGDMAVDTEVADMNADAMDHEEQPVPRLPHKRSRSRSPAPSITTTSMILANGDTRERAPKRLRRNKDATAYDPAAFGLARSNPMGRRNAKQEAKKARRAATRQVKEMGRTTSKLGGMDVDDDDIGVGDTFMVG